MSDNAHVIDHGHVDSNGSGGGGATVFATVSFKGGVGKSTLAVHLAASLEAVLVDFEPWGSATTWWAGAQTQRIWRAAGQAPILRALEKGMAPRPRRGAAGRPQLVPSHEQLLRLTDGADGGIASWAWDSQTAQPAVLVKTADGVRRIDDALAEALPRWAQSWNAHVVVDTPGGFSPLADAALAAADCVIVPFTLDPWSFPALSKFLAMYAPRVRSGLVVPNRVRDRVREDPYVAVLQEPGFIPPPFVLGPPVSESDILRFIERPLTAGGDPGRARRDAIAQIDAVAQRAQELAASTHKVNRQ